LNYGIPSPSSLAPAQDGHGTPDALLASGSHVGDGNVACETTGNGLFKGPDTSNLCLPTTSDLCSGRPSQISRPDVALILFDGKGHAARKTRFLLPKNDEGPISHLPSHHPPELVSLIEKNEKSKVSLAEWTSIEQNIPCDGQALPNFNLIPVQRTYSQGKVLPRDRGLLFHGSNEVSLPVQVPHGPSLGRFPKSSSSGSRFNIDLFLGCQDNLPSDAARATRDHSGLN